MSEYLEQAQRYHAAIRSVLLGDWDPIGINQVPEAQDEYDAYVGPIHALLVRREPHYKLVDYLWQVETEHMSLCGNRHRTEYVADRLLQLPQELTAS